MVKISPRAARTNAGYNQSEMAHLLGISKSSLVNKENGRTEFLKSEATKFAEIVGMPEDEIDFSCSDRINK